MKPKLLQSDTTKAAPLVKNGPKTDQKFRRYEKRNVCCKATSNNTHKKFHSNTFVLTVCTMVKEQVKAMTSRI